jgi:hypothetical protein
MWGAGKYVWYIKENKDVYMGHSKEYVHMKVNKIASVRNC